MLQIPFSQEAHKKQLLFLPKRMAGGLTKTSLLHWGFTLTFWPQNSLTLHILKYPLPDSFSSLFHQAAPNLTPANLPASSLHNSHSWIQKCGFVFGVVSNASPTLKPLLAPVSLLLERTPIYLTCASREYGLKSRLLIICFLLISLVIVTFLMSYQLSKET